MIIINGKIFRNLQEQVLYLTELIKEIKPYIAGNGITISEQTIAVDPDSVQLKLTAGNGIKIDGNTISADVSSANIAKIDIHTAGVTYKSTTGAKLFGNAVVHYEDESIDEAFMTFELPIEPGDGVTIETNEMGDRLVISASVGVAVEITLPSDVTSGTLTEEQTEKLLSNDNNWISINNERYILMDKEHTPGIRTYTHDGYNERGVVKYLNLTVSTRAFTIVESKNLTLPDVAPSDEAIVTVGVNNQQSQLFLGEGLSISGNTIVTDVQMSLSGTRLNITGR